MEIIKLLGAAVYCVTLLGLCAYGLHRYWMLLLFRRHYRQGHPPAARFAELPVMTVQLPLYNEQFVAVRLIDAVAAFDYPQSRLEIQVLDDSTDETTAIVAARVSALQTAGVDIRHMRRGHRQGYKAGALQHGLQQARGELIAVFDADFVPQPELLQQLVHEFTDPQVGLVQARWGHLNAGHSWLTRAQAMLLDGHFLIEHTARSRSGRFFNFNGTAGIWRRHCIEAAGGWHQDTLAEDLDLSYRAQLKGWRFVYRPDIVVPAELPIEINAFKSQQHRWAKGSMQVCKKLLPTVWRSRLPRAVKLEALVHLTSNLAYVLLFLLCLTLHVALPLLQPSSAGGLLGKLILFDVPVFLAASVPIMLFYITAQRVLGAGWPITLVRLPVLMAVGIGLSVNNARAVIEALCNHRSPFVRTPKYGDRAGQSRSAYRALRGIGPLIELGMAVYFTAIMIDSVLRQNWGVLPFVAIMWVGFACMGVLSLTQPTWNRWFPLGAAAPEVAG